MSQLKKSLQNAVFIGIIALAIMYVFWGNDIIPESVVAKGPGFIVGFADDAVVILGAIIAGTKWRNQIRGKKQKGTGLMDKIILVITITLILAYIFYAPDLLADGTPVIGYLDDAIIAIGLAKIGRKIRDKIGQ